MFARRVVPSAEHDRVVRPTCGNLATMTHPERVGWLVAVTGEVRLVAPGGTTHPIRGGQAQLVLAALALLRRPVLRDEVAELLWGDTPLPDHWAGAVRGVVSKVRSALVGAGLAPEVLRADAGAISLDPAVGCRTDLELAEAAVVLGRSQLAGGDAAGALRTVDGVAGDLGGPVLSMHDGDFCRIVRERVHRVVAEAEQVVAESLLALGRADDACARAARRIHADPLDETMYALLIRGHLAAGRPAAAQRAYDDLVAVLASEIGVRPGAATTALLSEGVRGRAAGEPGGEVFLGRAAQRELVLRVWAEVRERRRPAVIVVQGPAGIGKTRLVAELVGQITAAGHPSLWGRNRDGSGLAYEAVADALGRRAASHADLASAAGVDLVEVPALVPELGGDRSRVDSPLVARSQLFREVRAIVRGLAADGLVWVVDDAHWASSDTLALLEATLADLDEPVLVLVTARTVTGQLADVVARVQRDVHTVALALPALTEAELLPLAATLPEADAAGGDAAVARELFAPTGGHPFFVTELARDARRRGSVDARRVPEPVRDWVRRRVDALPLDLRSCVELAAVIGDDVDLALLDEAAGTTGTPRQVDGLIDLGFLVEGDGPGRVRFAHQITRDVVHDRIGTARRAECHAAVAKVLAGPGWPGRDAELAHHASRSGPSGRDVALAAIQRAASTSLARHAWQLAADQLRVALDLAADLPVDRARVLVALGAACHRLGRTVEARAALLDAVEIARDHDLATVLARAVLELVGRGGRGAATGMPDAEREELLREALHAMRHWPALAGDDEPSRELLVATLEGELSLAMLFSDRHDERRAIVLDAEARVRAHPHPDPVLLARVLLNARPAKTAPEQFRQRLDDVREVLAVPVDLLSSETRVAALTYLHEDLLRVGERALARRHLADARRAAGRIGHPFWQWATTTWASLDLVVDGRLDEAEHLLGTSLRLEEQAASEAAACLAVQLTDIRLFQGRGSRGPRSDHRRGDGERGHPVLPGRPRARRQRSGSQLDRGRALPVVPCDRLRSAARRHEPLPRPRGAGRRRRRPGRRRRRAGAARAARAVRGPAGVPELLRRRRCVLGADGTDPRPAGSCPRRRRRVGAVVRHRGGRCSLVRCAAGPGPGGARRRMRDRSEAQARLDLAVVVDDARGDEAEPLVERARPAGRVDPRDVERSVAVGAQAIGERSDHGRADAAALVVTVDQQPPQVRLRLGGHRLAQHHEPRHHTIGDDRSVPGHDQLTLVLGRDQRLRERDLHRRDELALEPERLERQHPAQEVGGDLDELDQGRASAVPPAPGIAVRAQEREARVVEPLAADRLGGTRRALVAEAERLDHAHRRDVPGIERRDDAVHRRVVEDRVDDRPRGLAREATPLELRCERVAEHRDAVAAHPDRDVADDHGRAVRGRELDRDLHPVVAEEVVRVGLTGEQSLRVGEGEGQVPVLEAGDLGIVAVRGEHRRVGGSHDPQGEAIGLQGEHGHAAIQLDTRTCRGTSAPIEHVFSR